MSEALHTGIAARTARISVIGQGYVGLPLAVAFAKAGFTVTGLDNDPDRAAALGSGRSHVPDVPSEELQALLRAGRYRAASDSGALAGSDVIVICVPTPLRKSKDPDISYVVAAAEEAAARYQPGQLVVLESTTYPGSTEELLRFARDRSVPSVPGVATVSEILASSRSAARWRSSFRARRRRGSPTARSRS